MLVTLKYEEFKTQVLNKSTSVQYIITDYGYDLYLIDGDFGITCVLRDAVNILDFETNLKSISNKPSYNTSSPFASKEVNGKKLFKRVHGVSMDCIVGENIITFSIPYNQCKITGMELIWGSEGDTCNLEVYDTPTGTISTIPNYKLNQFGFNVNVSVNHYEHKSEYDADLIKDMVLEVHYFSTQAKKIGINFILNELK